MNATLLEKDNWYAQHPDKLLATPVEVKGRYGMVTNYIGDVGEAIQKIRESNQVQPVTDTSNLTLLQLKELQEVFPSAKMNQNGVYLPSVANRENYIRDKALQKGIQLGKLDFVNDGTDLYDIYISDYKLVDASSPKNVTLPKVTQTPKEDPRDFYINEAHFPVLFQLLPNNQKDYFRQFNREHLREIEVLKSEYNSLKEVEAVLTKTPKLYGQSNISQGKKTVYAHYFLGDSDWYITEWDRETNEFFGFVILNGDVEMAELGYISFDELNTLNIFPNMINLDLHFPAQPLGKIMSEKGIEDYSAGEADEEEEEISEWANPVRYEESLPLSDPTPLPDVEAYATPEPTPAVSKIEAIIKKSEANITKKLNKPKKEEFTEAQQIDMYTFDEVHELMNGSITPDEFRVFVWYKAAQGQKLSQHWYDIANRNHDVAVEDVNQYSAQFKDWLQRGLLFYNGSGYEPRCIYQSGNVWEKIDLLRSRDKDYITTQHGEAVYNMHLETITQVYERMYASRAILDDNNEDSRLRLNPSSDFAKNFFIKSLSDGSPFMIRSSLKAKEIGEPDFIANIGTKESNKKLYESLSLPDAFKYFLIQFPTLYEIKKNVSSVQIIKVYFDNSKRPTTIPEGLTKNEWEAEWAKVKEDCKTEAHRLFNDFLKNELDVNDKIRLEQQWNKRYNALVPVDTTKVPVLFTINKTFKGNPINIYDYQREGNAFNFILGSSCLAFDVGYGKTITSILCMRMAMQAGYCSRPVVVVPNQVYKQFMGEVKALLPDVQVNDYYNLSTGYRPDTEALVMNGGVSSNSITLLTYDAMEYLGVDLSRSQVIFEKFVEILDQIQKDNKSLSQQQKQRVKLSEKALEMVARGNMGSSMYIEDFGFDYFLMDEAHNAKKIFTSVKGNVKDITDEGTVKRDSVEYAIQSGVPSRLGITAFFMAFNVYTSNNYKNVQLLTATPFTNSPLEIFSMLSLIAHKKLAAYGIANIKEFFDTYIKVEQKLVINAQLRPQYRQIVTGFNQLPGLQKLMMQFFLHKHVAPANLIRPAQWILPLTSTTDTEGKTVQLDDSNQVLTYLKLTDVQEELMVQIKEYCSGRISYQMLCAMVNESEGEYSDIENPTPTDDEDEEFDAEGVEVDENESNDKEKIAIRMLRGISFARAVAFSPYLFKCYKPKEGINHKSFIASSAKLSYVMGCVKSVRDYHLAHKQPVSGQIIYSNGGVDFFKYIKKYLVEEIGYKDHEVQLIVSGMPKNGKNSKDYIKNLFNGERYNEDTREFEAIPDQERVKIIIGSATIKEGINLQRFSTTLYNCWVDWNPTDAHQLIGRLRRQGNTYKNVRIVYPLSENSMDIFIFQKLQEKSDRINELWDIDGNKKVFKIEEFDPEEAKYSMITDPKVLATLELNKQRMHAQEQLKDLENKLSRIAAIKSDANFVATYKPQFLYHLQKYAFLFKETLPEDLSFEEMNKLDNYYARYSTTPIEMLKPENDRSMRRYFSYVFRSDLVTKIKTLKNDERTFLTQRGLTIESLDDIKPVLENEIYEFKHKLEMMHTEEYFQSLTMDQSLKMAVREPGNESTVENRVRQFATLNYLLDDTFAHEVAVVAPQLVEAVKDLTVDDELTSYNAAIEGLKIMLEFEEDPAERTEIESAIFGMELLIDDLKEQLGTKVKAVKKGKKVLN